MLLEYIVSLDAFSACFVISAIAWPIEELIRNTLKICIPQVTIWMNGWPPNHLDVYGNALWTYKDDSLDTKT